MSCAYYFLLWWFNALDFSRHCQWQPVLWLQTSADCCASLGKVRIKLNCSSLLCKIKANPAYSGLLARAFSLFKPTSHVYRIRRSPLMMSKEGAIKRESLFCFLGVFLLNSAWHSNSEPEVQREVQMLWWSWLELTCMFSLNLIRIKISFIHQAHPRNVFAYTVVLNKTRSVLCLIDALNTVQGMHSGFWWNLTQVHKETWLKSAGIRLHLSATWKSLKTFCHQLYDAVQRIVLSWSPTCLDNTNIGVLAHFNHFGISISISEHTISMLETVQKTFVVLCKGFVYETNMQISLLISVQGVVGEIDNVSVYLWFIITSST